MNVLLGKMPVLVCAALLCAGSAHAGDPVQWRVEDGGNGHWYRSVLITGSRDWHSAAAACSAFGGHLATISSAAENQFVFALAGPISDWPNRLGPWLGGFRDDQGWKWVTGEPWSWTAWEPGEPNNTCGGEDKLHFINYSSSWNDVASNGLACGGDPVWSYIVEWSADCNNDGLVDFGQIRSGQLADANGNSIPDCCEEPGTCSQGAVEWTVTSGGNGHWYEYVHDMTIGWQAAVDAAAGAGGHLATITSADENVFVFAYLDSVSAWVDVRGPFLGGYQDLSASDYAEPSGGWRWVTGEPWALENWSTYGFGEPNNDFGVEHALAMDKRFGGVVWNDVALNGHAGGQSSAYRTSTGYLIEWSADCNGDGIVDFGQIRAGQLADANSNGIPDLCESTIIVPAQFATIQAAIDSVPAGVAKVISVLPGTYNQMFSMNGKNIVVRGAPNNATILDGTGLTEAICRFTGGEPATAGVENLVFRNGTVGSRIYPKAPFRVGGAIYGANSSAFIRNCVFQSNTSDFGGGAYIYRSNIVIEGCQFLGNTGRNMGGGLMFFQTTGTVSDCVFTSNIAAQFGTGAATAFMAVGAKNPGETVLLVNCSIQSGIGGVGASAVEMFGDETGSPGVMLISNCQISGNSAGGPSTNSGGLRVVGASGCCILTGGTSICGNSPRNASGPFLIQGSATVCDCLADVTLDGVVNGGDLGVVLSAWGVASPNGAGDVNRDGFVDSSDLGQLLSAWGTCP
jgi:hypothetical protein